MRVAGSHRFRAYLWRKVLAELRGAPLRVIAPDLVGLGFSSRVPAEQHTLENHIRWLGGLMDRLELEDLVVVGQDWGGPIAMGAAAERPERIGGLVVLNTVLGPPRPGFKPTAFHRFSRLPVLSDLVFRGLGFGEPAPLALARMVPNSLQHPSVEPLTRLARFVESWEGPAEIVWGDRDPILHEPQSEPAPQLRPRSVTERSPSSMRSLIWRSERPSQMQTITLSPLLLIMITNFNKHCA